MLPSRCPFISREVQCIISRCQWMENSRITMLSHLVIWWMNLHKLRCSINLFWKWIVREMFFFICRKEVLTLKGHSCSSLQELYQDGCPDQHWWWCDLVPFSPKKSNVQALGPRLLVYFLRVRKAIKVKCPTNTRGPSSPLDLMLIDF